ncbi:hypothetical protein D3C81_1412540 [compost metagenome]
MGSFRPSRVSACRTAASDCSPCQQILLSLRPSNDGSPTHRWWARTVGRSWCFTAQPKSSIPSASNVPARQLGTLPRRLATSSLRIGGWPSGTPRTPVTGCRRTNVWSTPICASRTRMSCPWTRPSRWTAPRPQPHFRLTCSGRVSMGSTFRKPRPGLPSARSRSNLRRRTAARSSSRTRTSASRVGIPGPG